jgi:hypothetical protein
MLGCRFGFARGGGLGGCLSHGRLVATIAAAVVAAMGGGVCRAAPPAADTAEVRGSEGPTGREFVLDALNEEAGQEGMKAIALTVELLEVQMTPGGKPINDASGKPLTKPVRDPVKHTFIVDERYFIRVKPVHGDVFLYVIAKNTDGIEKVIYPDPKRKVFGRIVQQGESLVLPGISTEGKPFSFRVTAPTGNEELVVIATPSELDDNELAVYQQRAFQAEVPKVLQEEGYALLAQERSGPPQTAEEVVSAGQLPAEGGAIVDRPHPVPEDKDKPDDGSVFIANRDPEHPVIVVRIPIHSSETR